jgi:hypothetical protein
MLIVPAIVQLGGLGLWIAGAVVKSRAGARPPVLGLAPLVGGGMLTAGGQF